MTPACRALCATGTTRDCHGTRIRFREAVHAGHSLVAGAWVNRVMHVLVTGGAGYVGSSLVPALLARADIGRVDVVDRFYFGDSALRALEERSTGRLRLHRADVRTLDPALFQGVDALVDLAGISNDPACDLAPELTHRVNLDGASSVAEKAARAGVKRIVFASSCSVYGHGAGLALVEDSPLHPVSLYAKCKVEAEGRLATIAREHGVCATALRFATLFGVSSRMRFDLAVNVMTKNAYVNRRITVDGGGMQWRPFVHVRDVCDAITCVLGARESAVAGEVFNVGNEDNNIRILNLAYRVRDRVPGTEILIGGSDPDMRDYNVSFEKAKRVLDFVARRTIDEGIDEVLEALREARVDPAEREGYTMKQYVFLADVDRTFARLSVDGRVL